MARENSSGAAGLLGPEARELLASIVRFQREPNEAPPSFFWRYRAHAAVRAQQRIYDQAFELVFTQVSQLAMPDQTRLWWEYQAYFRDGQVDGQGRMLSECAIAVQLAHAVATVETLRCSYALVCAPVLGFGRHKPPSVPEEWCTEAAVTAVPTGAAPSALLLLVVCLPLCGAMLLMFVVFLYIGLAEFASQLARVSPWLPTACLGSVLLLVWIFRLLSPFSAVRTLEVGGDGVRVRSSGSAVGDERFIPHSIIRAVQTYRDEYDDGEAQHTWRGVVLTLEGGPSFGAELGDQTERVAKVICDRTHLVARHSRSRWRH